MLMSSLLAVKKSISRGWTRGMKPGQGVPGGLGGGGDWAVDMGHGTGVEQSLLLR
jgi:hypothetical protein